MPASTGERKDATAMLRKAQHVWESTTGKTAKDLQANASYAQLNSIWHKLAALVPGALDDTDAALQVAKDVTASGDIAFPAFLRISTHLPWYHLLSLEKEVVSDLAETGAKSGARSGFPPTPPEEEYLGGF